MAVFGPVFGPVLMPVFSSPFDAGAGDMTAQVKALFGASDKGVMFDLTRAANLYTDSARTTLVTASGDAIGSATDLSPNGKHASSSGPARPLWNSAGYATFDAFDDYMQTAAIDFSGTDKITVVVSVTKSSDVAGMVCELSASTGTNPGSFYIVSGNDGGNGYATFSRGSAATGTGGRANFLIAAPDTAVVTAINDIPGDLSRIFRNAVMGTDGTADKGSGNFGNYPLNIGARNTASVLFNGRIYRLLVIGRALTTTERSTAERWAAQPAGITIP